MPRAAPKASTSKRIPRVPRRKRCRGTLGYKILVFLANGAIQLGDGDFAAIGRVVDGNNRLDVELQPIDILDEIRVVGRRRIWRRRVGLSRRIKGVGFDEDLLLGRSEERRVGKEC